MLQLTILVARQRAQEQEIHDRENACQRNSSDINRMPVEDVTVEWSEQLSPFVTVAKVRIPRQDISGDDNLEKMDALSFTPWRVTAEHCPLGNIMRARKEVYRRASVLRHTLNHQQRKEPGSADEVLP
jgi:nicotinic acid mononucleotide adenylyltransferase